VNEITAPDLFNRNFLDYTAYVIRERAIPDINDGLLPLRVKLLQSHSALEEISSERLRNLDAAYERNSMLRMRCSPCYVAERLNASMEGGSNVASRIGPCQHRIFLRAALERLA